MESVWAIEKFETYAEGEPQTLFVPTTNGIFISVIYPTGDFAYCMESYYDGINVTNALVLNEDELLLSTLHEGQNKLIILNLETKQERIIISPEAAVYFLDICKIPGSPGGCNFYILHTGKGIQLVNAEQQKAYDLATNVQTNFNVCRSICIQSIDPEDPSQGFWLAQIDNGVTMQ